MSDLSFGTIRAHLRVWKPRRIHETDTIAAAVAVLLTPGVDGVDLLLIKRAVIAGDPWSGQIALPGGRRDSSDQHLLATAQREAREETGIDLTEADLLGELDDLRPSTRTLPPVVVRPFVFGLPERPEVRANPEVDLHLWVSVSTLKSSAQSRQVVVRGEALEVPAYVIGPHVVWGITWRIITPIIHLA